MRCILPQTIRSYINNTRRCCIFRTHEVYEPDIDTPSKWKDPLMDLSNLAQIFNHRECMDYIKHKQEEQKMEERKRYEFVLSMCNISTSLSRMCPLGFPV